MPDPWSRLRRLDLSDEQARTGLLSVGRLPSATKEKKWRATLVGAVVGGGLGAVTGLVLYEIVERRLDFCDEKDEGCEISPTRTETILIGAAVGALIGAGAFRVADNSSALPVRAVLIPDAHRGPTVGVSYRYRLR